MAANPLVSKLISDLVSADSPRTLFSEAAFSANAKMAGTQTVKW